MKKSLLVLAIILCVHSLVEGQHNIITYNIRLDVASDGEHAWPFRKENVANLLRFHKADIFCCQEALYHQLQFLDSVFEDFDYAGVGRDDGQQAGEFSPVFYNTAKYNLITGGEFWLSESPEKPSFGWDAACRRICTWVELEDKVSGKHFYVYNTHFDHKGVQARKESADLILSRISNRVENYPVILCGDFNLPPDAEPIRMIAATLDDSYSITELGPYGARGTWAGFTYDDEAGDRIDYVFVSKGVKVRRYAHLTDSRDRSYYSDHLPVLVEVDF